MKTRCLVPVLVSSVVFAIAGCGGSSGTTGTGGAPASGGSLGSGGGTASGGTTGSGGALGTGGVTGTGGVSSSGGAIGDGGAPASGGTTGTGGATGGTGGSSGASGTGGRAGGGGATTTGGRGGAPGTGGSAGATGAGGISPTMNFFVTSRGPGNGGNLSGLPGADAFCKTLATAVSAALGAKTWHAYLSTSTVNAKDRIGSGPWYNAAGRVIANNLTDLHDQTAANAALNATWPIGSTTIALDERGAQVPTTPLVHDILTGSNTDGTVATGLTCNDWTSAAATVTAQIGHSNRTGGGRPPSWNSAHATTGCAEPTADMMAGTVSSGGGRGSLYCFAVP